MIDENHVCYNCWSLSYLILPGHTCPLNTALSSLNVKNQCPCQYCIIKIMCHEVCRDRIVYATGVYNEYSKINLSPKLVTF